MTRTEAVVSATGVIAGAAAAAAAGYLGLVSGAITIDLGAGRRIRALGPMSVIIEAPQEVVFTALSEPYLARQSRAIAEKIRIIERGDNMVLAEHRTPVGARLVAVTIETVRFAFPSRVDFRLTRGPVPHVVEQFHLIVADGRTVLEYTGELGTDLWAVGAWWGDRVAGPWERAVADTFAVVKSEAERRHALSAG